MLAAVDKLNVFISSTIGECAAERQAAEAGVRATNHEPIVFEKIGARPHPPRDVYLSRLRQAHIVVAIYRDSYGYVDQASGMAMSGVEDEYRHAVKFGLPILVYIRRDEAARNARLSSLLAEVMNGGLTVFFYTEPAELEDQIRDDVTAVATQKFLDASSSLEALKHADETAISGSAPPGGFINRDALVSDIDAAAAAHPVVEVTGPGGSGKTVLMTQLADRSGYRLIYGDNLSPKELFGVLANMLLADGLPARQFATYEGARLAFASAWAEATGMRLIVDDTPHIDVLLEAVEQSGPSAGRSLVITSRQAQASNAFSISVPALSLDEIKVLLRNAGQSASAASSMLEDTNGNPLRVRQQIISSGKSLREIWTALSPVAREIASYLVVASAPLPTAGLLALHGDNSYGAEALFADMEGMPELVVGTGAGFRIVHDDVRDELRAIVAERAERMQFYAGQLGNFLANEGQVVAAYFTFREAGHPKAAKLLDAAAFEAARSGDWTATVRITRDVLAAAEQRVDKEDAIHAHLALAQALEVTGNTQAASDHMDAADKAAVDASEDIRAYVDTLKLVFDVHHHLSAHAIERLVALRDQFAANHREWQAARLSLELSAANINVHDSGGAEREARVALAGFVNIGDEHGIGLARRNLASALVAQADKAEEADRLIREIEAEDHGGDGRRTKAWLCNVLVRKNRTARRYEDAEANAREAIAIGRELGDEGLVAINSIGLGNVLSDQDQYEAAIYAYDQAAQAARRCRRHEVEAHASYLAANTYNEVPKGHPLHADAATRAEMLARHAIGLMQDTIAHDHIGRAYEALAASFFGREKLRDAVEALFESAAHFLPAQNWDALERVLMTACYNSNDMPDVYEAGVNRMLKLDLSKVELTASRTERLFQPLRAAILGLPRQVMIPFLGCHTKMMVRGLPPLIVRRLVDLTLAQIRSAGKETADQPWRILYATLVLAAGCAEALTNQDFLRIAEGVSEDVPGLSAVPEHDGGARWFVQLHLPEPVALTISPIDDSKATTLACLLLALFLKGFEADLGKDLLAGTALVAEVPIQIANFDTMPTDLRPFVAASIEDKPCVVTRLTEDPTQDMSTPTMVFVSRQFLRELSVGEGRGGSLQVLAGYTALEVAIRILGNTISPEELGPKMVKLVRGSIS